MHGFLHEPYQERIIFTLNAAALLTASYEFPEKPVSKIVFFLRMEVPHELTLKNMSEVGGVLCLVQYLFY